jgi:hypothetical protein
MPDDISKLGKGALPQPPDERDYKAESIMGVAQVDWSNEFRLPEPPDDDQGSSDTCVAHAWSSYHWQLHGKTYSRRDLFTRIALEYGAYIKDGGWQVVNNGQATKDEVPDPSVQTMQNMRDKSGINQMYRDDDKELNYFIIQDGSIDGVALAVTQYKGVVFGLNGTNPGWTDLLNPRPPKPGEVQWGHALYAMGYHLHNGVKCIIAKSSWCRSVREHHIKENYFTSGNTFNAWTLIPKDQQMNSQIKIAIIHGEAGFFLAASDIPQMQSAGKMLGKEVQVAPDGKTITNADIVV